jgi:hypothetical protein
MLAVLLAGELYLSVKPVALPMLLLELLEVALLVVGAIACTLLVRRVSQHTGRAGSCTGRRGGPT